MTATANNSYLRDAILTATPEQLQLMLYDGAIRFATEGREAVEQKRYDESYEKLSRAQKIVLEMQQGLNHEVAPELCDRMAALYNFIYRRLVEGCVRKDPAAINDAIKILQIERETWVIVMEKLADARAAHNSVPIRPAAPGAETGGGLCVEG